MGNRGPLVTSATVDASDCSPFLLFLRVRGKALPPNVRALREDHLIIILVPKAPTTTTPCSMEAEREKNCEMCFYDYDDHYIMEHLCSAGSREHARSRTRSWW